MDHIVSVRGRYAWSQGEIWRECGDRLQATNASDFWSERCKTFKMLKNFYLKSVALCNNKLTVDKVLEDVRRSGRKAAFVTYDYEFQYNWAAQQNGPRHSVET